MNNAGRIFKCLQNRLSGEYKCKRTYFYFGQKGLNDLANALIIRDYYGKFHKSS